MLCAHIRVSTRKRVTSNAQCSNKGVLMRDTRMAESKACTEDHALSIQGVRNSQNSLSAALATLRGVLQDITNNMVYSVVSMRQC